MYVYFVILQEPDNNILCNKADRQAEAVIQNKKSTVKKPVSPYQAILSFNSNKKKGFLKTLCKKEKVLVACILCEFHNIFYHLNDKCQACVGKSVANRT